MPNICNINSIQQYLTQSALVLKLIFIYDYKTLLLHYKLKVLNTFPTKNFN